MSVAHLTYGILDNGQYCCNQPTSQAIVIQIRNIITQSPSKHSCTLLLYREIVVIERKRGSEREREGEREMLALKKIHRDCQDTLLPA